MNQDDTNEQWDAYEDGNHTLDPDWEEHYWQALNSEMTVINPIVRKWNEWQWINSPMTKDDLLDTMLFIKSIKER